MGNVGLPQTTEAKHLNMHLGIELTWAENVKINRKHLATRKINTISKLQYNA
jgi:hypothetical protein